MNGPVKVGQEQGKTHKEHRHLWQQQQKRITVEVATAITFSWDSTLIQWRRQRLIKKRKQNNVTPMHNKADRNRYTVGCVMPNWCMTKVRRSKTYNKMKDSFITDPSEGNEERKKDTMAIKRRSLQEGGSYWGYWQLCRNVRSYAWIDTLWEEYIHTLECFKTVAHWHDAYNRSDYMTNDEDIKQPLGVVSTSANVIIKFGTIRV